VIDEADEIEAVVAMVAAEETSDESSDSLVKGTVGQSEDMATREQTAPQRSLRCQT